MHTPEEVVLRLLLGRHLERDDLAAARVDAAHDVLHGAVLARGVHALEDDEHRVPALRVEHVLELRQARDVVPEPGAGGGLVGVLAGFGGVDAAQPDARAGPDAGGGHGGALYPPAVGAGNRAPGALRYGTNAPRWRLDGTPPANPGPSPHKR